MTKNTLICFMMEGSESVHIKTDPDPGDPKAYGSGYETLSATLVIVNFITRNWYVVINIIVQHHRPIQQRQP